LSYNGGVQPELPAGLGRARARPPFYKRAGFYLPLIFIISFGGALGAMWWFSPVTNQLSGETENRGSRALRTTQNLFNPRKPLDQYFMGRDSVSILMLGLDHVPTRKSDPNPPRRADSILLANVGFGARQVRLLSVPRDGWVEQLRLNRSDELESVHDKLAHSFSYGMQEDDADPIAGGIKRTKETVESLMGVPVDFYVVIQFEGFVKLIDALGGLDMDVEKRMKYTDRAGGLFIDLQPGPQHLTGEQAVGYARFRHDKWGDIGRMERQQKVITVVIEKLKLPENAVRYPDLAKLMLESVRSNMTVDQLYALALHANEFQTAGIQTQTLMSYYNREPGHRIELPGEYGGVAAQYIDPADIEKSMVWWNDLAAPPPPPAAGESDGGLPAPPTTTDD
jgi:LCP family protein required for cell wall assembly